MELWVRNNRKYNWSQEFGQLKKDFPDAELVNDGGWGQCLRLETLDFEKDILLLFVCLKMYYMLQNDQNKN